MKMAQFYTGYSTDFKLYCHDADTVDNDNENAENNDNNEIDCDEYKNAADDGDDDEDEVSTARHCPRRAHDIWNLCLRSYRTSLKIQQNSKP